MFAEWEKQEGVAVIYPHRFCDFSDILDEVEEVYDELIAKIARVENVYIILHPRDTNAKNRLNSLLKELGEEIGRAHV